MDCVKAIEELKNQSFKVYGTGFNQSVLLESVEKSEKIAIILGNEGNGVRNELLRKSDAIIRIETSKFNSLNVGVATGILLHYFRK
jgi:RNA methyltransferase, TrmH family